MKVGDKVYINKKVLANGFFGTKRNDEADYVIITDANTHVRAIYPWRATVYFTDGTARDGVFFLEEELISIPDIKKKEFNKILGNL